MSNGCTRHLATLDVEQRCHARVLRSLDTVPEERRADEEFDQAVDLYAHLLASRDRWLARLRGEPDQESDWFPKGWELGEMPARTEATYDAWRAYLSELSDDDLARWYRYTSWEGDPFENRIEDIVVQLEGHSLYHRAQIAMLVRRLGGKPAATDHVLMTRRPATP